MNVVTLFRQLIFAVTFLIVLLMSGNLVVSVANARGYLFEQMQVHAQDTATSLGLTISHAAKGKDDAQIQSFVDVVFDRGYYRDIIYSSLSGDVTVKRHLPITVEGVPAWFVELVDLPEPEGRAEVVSGWFRLGELVVVSHPGYAYRDLWRVFCEQLWLFLFIAVLSYGLVGIGLRYLLRPLAKVEAQAEAICRREFPVQEDLPRTPELRRMVVAMNRMVTKIQSMFQEQVELTESLHRKAYLDPVTQLSNRRDFDSRFEAFIKSERGGSPGIMLLINLSGLQQFNERFGRDAGDQRMAELAKMMHSRTDGLDGAILSRRGGADLCAFIPVVDLEEGKGVAASVFEGLVSMSWLNKDADLDVHMGASFTAQVMLGNELLKQADSALRQAQQLGLRHYHWYQQSSDTQVRSGQEWRNILVRAIEDQSFDFHLQPIFAADGTTLQQQEALCRLTFEGEVLSAGVFLPMAERFDLSPAIDRVMIQLLAAYVGSLEDRSSVPMLCINLSPRSVGNSEFVLWLLGFLDQNPSFAKQLMIELPEQALVLNEAAVRSFAEQTVAVGAQISLDHFGSSASAFHYLQSLPLAALKIDRQFVQGIEQKEDNQFFIKSLLHIAHSCDVALRAEGIETQAEWQQLVALGVDGGQGYLLGEPRAVSV